MKTKQGREEGGREGLSGEVTLEQKGIPGQEKSRRKGPEAHAHWNALEMTIVRSGWLQIGKSRENGPPVHVALMDNCEGCGFILSI